MSCVLRITGNNFEVDRFLNEIGLTAYLHFKTGDNLGFKRRGKVKHETNGCSFDLSFADISDFETQKLDTINFLKTHFDKFKKLKDFGLKINDVPIVDFAIESRLNQFEVQSEYLQPELLKLVSDLEFGITITTYSKSMIERLNDK